jgi:hypothetical protein
LENDLSTYDITRSNQTAFDADMFSIREQLSHRGSTDAGLGCASGIHGNQLPTSIRSFVGKFCNERRPASVVYRLGQHSSSKNFDVQVFDNDCAEVSNETERLPMLKLIPQPINPSVNFLEQSDRFPSTVRTLLATGNLALPASKFGFSGSVPARIWNHFTIGQGSEGFQTDINSNCVVERRQDVGFALNGETDIPLAALTLHSDRLNLARDRSVQLNLDFSDALNAQRVAREFDAVSVTRKRNAVEAATRLEPRISRCLVPLHSKKERFECLVHAAKDILAAREIGKSKVASSTNVFQLIRLVVVVQRLFVAAIGVAPFLHRAIVESAGFAKLPVENFRLGACRE